MNPLCASVSVSRNGTTNFSGVMWTLSITTSFPFVPVATRKGCQVTGKVPWAMSYSLDASLMWSVWILSNSGGSHTNSLCPWTPVYAGRPQTVEHWTSLVGLWMLSWRRAYCMPCWLECIIWQCQHYGPGAEWGETDAGSWKSIYVNDFCEPPL